MEESQEQVELAVVEREPQIQGQQMVRPVRLTQVAEAVVVLMQILAQQEQAAQAALGS